MSEVTIEVDPEDLSQEVREELENEADLNSDLAEKKADEAYLNNIEINEPNKSSVSGFISAYVENISSNLCSLVKDGCRIGEIVDVKSKRYRYVVLKIDVGFSIIDLEIKEESEFLSQLMGYHNVGKITELKNKKIAFNKRDSFRLDKAEFLIPKNLNPLSNIRYKFYSIQNDLYSKTLSVFDEYDNKIFGTIIISYIVCSFLLLLSSVSVNIITVALSVVFGLSGMSGFLMVLYLFISFMTNDAIEGSWKNVSDTI